jgi:CRISPR-associated protein Cas1
VARSGETVTSLPWGGLQAIVLFGAHQISTPALRAAFAHRVPVHFASGSGRYQGTTWDGAPTALGRPLWLAQQTWFADSNRCLTAARTVVESRIRHQREVLRQRLPGAASDRLRPLDDLLARLGRVASLAELHGLEGAAARLYFALLQPFGPASLGFSGRNRLPPRDPFNALLSFGYTVLYAHVDTVLRASGLLPGLGFYHQPHGRHAVLASDLMEPFRHLVERAALRAVAKGGLRAADFYLDAERGCRMEDNARRRYLALLLERFDTPVSALGGTPKPLHQHLADQNSALIAWIREEVAEFQAWRVR